VLFVKSEVPFYLSILCAILKYEPGVNFLEVLKNVVANLLGLPLCHSEERRDEVISAGGGQ
jgi:hypothetical protein